MKSYLLVGNEEYIEIYWNEPITEERAYTHIGCKGERMGRKVGKIVYRAASSFQGLQELAWNGKRAIYLRKHPSNFKGGGSCYEVDFYGSFSARFEVEGGTVRVFHHPDADVEILVDDVFQMALSEVVRDAGGWVFHASGVSYKDQGLLLVGSSVSGKSTACLSLLLNGFSLLGDDASLVIGREKFYWAVPLARELSVRLQALSLFQFSHQVVLNPLGDRFFWREASRPLGPVPLKVISSLEIGAGEQTYLEEVAPREFCVLFKHKPPLHGFNKDNFTECVEDLAQGGVRFIRGRLGISPQATSEAYLNCLEEPARGCWQGRGSRRVMTIENGRKLVARCWTDTKTISLQEIIPLLAHPYEGLARSAQVVLKAEPLSRLEPLPWEDYDELWASDEQGKEEINWCRVQEWKDGSRGLLESADWRSVGENVEQWLRVAPILYPFLRHYSQDNPQLRSLIDDGWRKYLAWKYPPQLTLYLTDRYQLRCPYCYAGEKLKVGSREEVWKKLERILDWAKEENLSSISLTDGKPALYTWFPALVKVLKKRGLPFYFATNLLFPPSLWRWIKEAASLEIHLYDPRDYSSSQLQALNGNLKWLRRQDFPKVFRYNLWRRQISDWEWVTDIAVEFSDGNLAFAVPFPSPTGKKLFLARKQLEEFAEVVVEFVRHSEKKGLKATAVKPYPLCAFSGGEALYLLQKGALRGTCEIAASGCIRNMVVDHELRAFPCIALDLSPGSITSFPNRNLLWSNPKRVVRELFKWVDYQRCQGCELRRWKLCMAGCLGHYRSPENAEISG